MSHFETAGAYLARSGFSGRGGTLAFDGEYYRLSNGAGFELDGVLGSTDLFDRAWFNGRKLGSVGAMLNFVANGRPTWIPVDRVLSAEVEESDGRRRARITGRGGRNGILFTATLAFTVYPDRPWVLAELSAVENTGPVPVDIKAVFFTLPAPFAGEGECKGRPRPREPLPCSDYWRAGDGRVWGVESHARGLHAMRFWVDAQRQPHADAAVLAATDGSVPLPPGAVFRPADGEIWMCIKGEARDVGPLDMERK